MEQFALDTQNKLFTSPHFKSVVNTQVAHTVFGYILTSSMLNSTRTQVWSFATHTKARQQDKTCLQLKGVGVVK